MAKIIFIDVETTDLNPKLGNITELAYIYEVNGIKKEQKEYKGLEHNIYNSFVKDLNRLVDPFDKTDKLYFVGYNVRFDIDFVREMFIRNNDKFYGSYFYTHGIDILQDVVKYCMLKGIHPENFKLLTILKEFKIPVNEKNLHGALYDIQKSYELFKKINNNKIQKNEKNSIQSGFKKINKTTIKKNNSKRKK